MSKGSCLPSCLPRPVLCLSAAVCVSIAKDETSLKKLRMGGPSCLNIRCLWDVSIHAVKYKWVMKSPFVRHRLCLWEFMNVINGHAEVAKFAFWLVPDSSDAEGIWELELYKKVEKVGKMQFAGHTCHFLSAKNSGHQVPLLPDSTFSAAELCTSSSLYVISISVKI